MRTRTLMVESLSQDNHYGRENFTVSVSSLLVRFRLIFFLFAVPKGFHFLSDRKITVKLTLSQDIT